MGRELRAILIGSSQFPADPALAPLRCPEHDVDGLSKLLSSEARGGYREVLPLKNKAHYEVLRTVNLALKQAKKDDFLLIYYSGHGKLDRAGRLYLAASNTETQALESTSIPVATILDYISLSNCRCVGLILDCCYSGAVGDSLFRGGVDDQLQHIQQASSGGVYILTASTGVQVAEEKEKDEYGLLTKHIIQGVESGEADLQEDGQISMDELYDYVHEKVRQEGFQEPMKWDLGVTGDLIVALSGRTPREDRRKQIRQLMLDHAREGLISDRLLSQALEVLQLRPDEFDGELRKRDDLLGQLLDKRLPLGEFMDQWFVTDLGRAIAKETEAPKAGAVKTNPHDGQTYVWIPPGEFQMGCSPGDNECCDDEKPPHKVTISRGFWLGETPVTVGAYRRFAEATGVSMPAEPTIGKRKLNPQWSDLEQPVVGVTWEEARSYCESWAKGRLPSEAEWEWAARAGSTAARYGALDAIAWSADNSGNQRLDSVRAWEKDAACDAVKYLGILEKNGNRIHRVREKQPNAWGLYDMLGNVWEWISDWYQEDYYWKLTGPPSGTMRVLRGGSWDIGPRHIRASDRSMDGPQVRSDAIGFRCAREVIP